MLNLLQFTNPHHLKINDKLEKLDKHKIKQKIINHASKYINFKNLKMKSDLILSHKVKFKNDKGG